MTPGSRAPSWERVLAALAVLAAAASCNYDFDTFDGLSPPLDGGASSQDVASDLPRPDSARDASGKDISADISSDTRGGDGSAGQGGTAGSAGAGGAGGAAAGGTGGSAGAGATGGTGGAGAGGAGGGTGGTSTGGSAGTGTGGTGTGGSGTGGTGAGGAGGTGGSGGTATGGSAGSGAGGSSTGGTAGSGTGGSAGTGTGGAAGARPDGGTTPDVRVDIVADTTPFDCASVGGRINQNHCYYAMTAPVTWEVASTQTCVAPAHIVTINNANEQTFVASFLPGDSRWIGLYRPTGSAKSPSSYVWVTGEANGYSHWYTSNGEPDYDGECVRLGPSDSWGDHPCSVTFPVICERE